MAKKPDTVIVSEERRPVHAYEPQTMNPILLGYLVSRIYQGERVQRHSFIPENDVKKSEFSLGPTTTKFQFVDHIAAIDPLLDQGYKIKDQIIGKGGLQCYTVLEPQDPVIVADPIKWDHDIWEVPKGTDPTLTETVIFHTTVRPGKGIHYRRGVFRQICTNGLVAEILGLGSGSFTHTNWSADKVASTLGVGGINDKNIWGPVVGDSNGVRKFADLIERFGDPDAPEVPFYIQKQLNPLLRMPDWWKNSYVQHLRALAGTGDFLREVRVLDILNAATSPVNLERRSNPDRAVLRPLARLNSLCQASWTFIGVLSLS